MIMTNSWKYSTSHTSKYHAQKTTVDGITFDSKKEAMRYQELRLLERAGEIKNLQLQVPYVLIENSKYGQAVRYFADFVYEEKGQTVVEDCKGYRIDVYKLKKRLLAEKYGIEIKES